MIARRFVAGAAALIALAQLALADPIPLATAPIDLVPGRPEVASIGKLEWRGGIVIASTDSRFGGLSGLEALPDGRLVAVSDLGDWFTFRPVFDAAGRLVGVRDGDLTPLADERGSPFAGKFSSDAESVRADNMGNLLVSFERRHRVLRYRKIGGPGTPIPIPADAQRQPENGGVEALAAWPDGRILLLSERERNQNGDVKGWLRAGGVWHTVSYATGGEFQPTDAAVLPSGDLLVLERRYFPVLVSQGARIRRIPAALVAPKSRLSGPALAEWEAPYTVDNMEGMAVSRAPDGAVLVWVVSDDNQIPLQRTLLMLFRME